MKAHAIGLLILSIGARASAQAPATSPTVVEAAPPVVAAPPPMALPPPQLLGPRGPILYVAPPVETPLVVQPGAERVVRPRVRRMASRPRSQAVEQPRVHGDAGAPFALGVGGSLLWRNDHANRLLSTHNATSAFDVFASYDVWTPFRGAILSAGASLRTEAHLGNHDYELRNNALQADAMLRYGVTRWLWPHVRASVGGVTSRFSYRDPSSELAYRDRDGSAMGTFGAGFTVRTPARWFETRRGHLASLSFGLLIEGGYTVAKDASFKLDPSTSTDLNRVTFSLGSVERSAPYLRMMAVVRL